jgi:hypothetical protein
LLIQGLFIYALLEGVDFSVETKVAKFTRLKYYPNIAYFDIFFLSFPIFLALFAPPPKKAYIRLI